MAGPFVNSAAPSAATGTRGGRGVRFAARALATTAVAATLLSAASLSASAAPGDTAVDSVVANVNVNSTITLNLDQGNFDLNGIPGSTVDKTAAVTGVVTTNNAAGYSVGVVAAATTLRPSLAANPDSIPIANLEVTDATGDFTPLSTTVPVITTTQATRSALTGDAFSDDYQVEIPDVNSDTYSVTLNYTATALA